MFANIYIYQICLQMFTYQPPRLSPKESGKSAASKLPGANSTAAVTRVTKTVSIVQSGSRARRPSSLQYCLKSSGAGVSRLSVPRTSLVSGESRKQSMVEVVLYNAIIQQKKSFVKYLEDTLSNGDKLN